MLIWINIMGDTMSTYLSNLLITTHLVWLKADISRTLLNILRILSEILRLIFVSLRNGIQINASFRAYGATWQNKIFFIVPSVKTLKCHIHVFLHIFTFISVLLLFILCCSLERLIGLLCRRVKFWLQRLGGLPPYWI